VIDKEWREAIDLRSSLVSIGLVVVSGLLLRYWNLRHGLIAPLETDVIDPVLQLIHTGSYRPQALTQPTLPIYLHAFVAIVHFILGAIVGVWRSVGEFGPGQVVAWGRGLSALLGTAVVFIVYQIGMRWGARHALLAAGLMAVTPTHVAVSRQIGQGSPLTFFSALSLLLSLVAIERGGRRRFIIAGAAAGFAAASHYAGIVVVIVPLVAAWMTKSDESSRVSRAAAVSVAAIVAFVVATPLSVRDLPGFLNGLAIAASPTGTGMADHVELLQQLVWGLQWPGVILAFAGLSLGIVRAITGPGHTRWTLLVSFPVVYFTLVAWHGASSETILLPLLPAATVIAAIAVISGVSLLRRFDIPRAARTALIAALTVVAVLPPAVFSIELVRQAGREGVSARADRSR
jgi:4-amino-4-deoxy-L-arabinose transferase-like glycosyltransferase